eukprot:2525688-Rhodomonas_salina.1
MLVRDIAPGLCRLIADTAYLFIGRYGTLRRVCKRIHYEIEYKKPHSWYKAYWKCGFLSLTSQRSGTHAGMHKSGTGRIVEAGHEIVCPHTPRNRRQETALLVQVVLKLRFLVFDFGVYAMSVLDTAPPYAMPVPDAASPYAMPVLKLHIHTTCQYHSYAMSVPDTA